MSGRGIETLAEAVGRITQLARLEHDGRVLTVAASYGETGARIIITNDDDPAAQSVVLTNYEVRWLVHRVFGGDDETPEWRYRWVNFKWRMARLIERARSSAAGKEPRQ